MSKVVVSDSSCLIALSKIDKLFILKEIFDEILIPPAVFHEVVTLGEGRSGAKMIQSLDWIKQVQIENQLALQTLKLTLGAGEAEAIVLASEIKPNFVILDDRKARQLAIDLSLPVIGTIAIVSKGVEKGVIQDFDQTVHELIQVGFRFKISKK